MITPYPYFVTGLISGGQWGADHGGLRAGEILGIQTGGFAPKGWKTERGPNPALAKFGLVESRSADYPERTEMNVMCSDGTVIFGLSSVGSKLTETCCRMHDKPVLWLSLDWNINRFRTWLVESKIQTLNVAGNRESKNKGIGKRVEQFLVRALVIP